MMQDASVVWTGDAGYRRRTMRAAPSTLFVLAGVLLGARATLADTPQVAPVTTLSAAADPEVAERASGAFRIESEFKLSVPDGMREPLREHLKRRYGPGEESLLRELGPGFSATLSDEAFLDRYFDTPGLAVLHAEGGVRHRSRRNLGDASKDRKHGRQLVQFKLRRPGDAVLNRTEIKFEVDPPRDRKSDLDRHPLLGLVDRDDQQAVLRTAAEHGFDALELRPTLAVEQRRWRVYVSRDGAPFSTLTLDEVESRLLLSKVEFVELEIELNEVAYTQATPAERVAMESVSRRMADDVLATFPSLRQDQTPKYNKVYDAFSTQLPQLDLLILHGESIVTALGLGLPLLLVVGWAIASKVRRRLAERRRRASAPGARP